MTRARSEAMVVRPTNSVYTVLTGVACLTVLIALVLVFMEYRTLTVDGKLFFGLF